MNPIWKAAAKIESLSAERQLPLTLALVTAWLSLAWIFFAAIPFYEYGIDHYSYEEIDQQRTHNTGRLTRIKAFGPLAPFIFHSVAFGPLVMPLLAAALGVVLLANWCRLSRQKRLGWGAATVFAVLIALWMRSPIGRAIWVWFLD
jgi:hypothetical protein